MFLLLPVPPRAERAIAIDPVNFPQIPRVRKAGSEGSARPLDLSQSTDDCLNELVTQMRSRVRVNAFDLSGSRKLRAGRTAESRGLHIQALDRRPLVPGQTSQPAVGRLAWPPQNDGPLVDFSPLAGDKCPVDGRRTRHILGGIACAMGI
jgi:hypothetical protein